MAVPLLVRYAPPLVEGTLRLREKRFLAHVTLDDGRELTAHCPNPGRMTTCSAPGSRVRLQDTGNPKRKLPWTLEQVRAGRTWVNVHTGRPNDVIAEALARGLVPGIDAGTSFEREVPDGAGSRFDFRATLPQGVCWIEVKNVSLRVGREAQFPDAVTQRGLKHLHALRERVVAGEQALLCFYVSRADVVRVRPAYAVDPAYSEALAEVVTAGVRVVALRGSVTRRGLGVRDVLPVATAPS